MFITVSFCTHSTACVTTSKTPAIAQHLLVPSPQLIYKKYCRSMYAFSCFDH